MATAKVHDGHAIVAYVDGHAVDANGVEIEGAAKQPKDTDPSQQPHAMAQLNPDERSAKILAGALATALAPKATVGAEPTAEERAAKAKAEHR